MNIKEMIEVMQAFEDGKTIEARRNGTVTTTVCTRDWSECPTPVWDWLNVQYRIAPEPEPKKEGWWERVEIFAAAGQYRLNVGGFIDYCSRVPGFGGIDYQSPFDPKVIVRSMVPVMFRESSKTAFVICEQTESCRPGIPVAAWFWRES